MKGYRLEWTKEPPVRRTFHDGVLPIAIAVLLLSAAMGVDCVYEFVTCIRLARHGKAAVAEITSYQPFSGYKTYGTIHRHEFRFDRVHYATRNDFVGKMPIGSTFEIIYLPENPMVLVRGQAGDSAFRLWVDNPGTGGDLFSVMFIAGGISLGIFLLRHGRRAEAVSDFQRLRAQRT